MNVFSRVNIFRKIKLQWSVPVSFWVIWGNKDWTHKAPDFWALRKRKKNCMFLLNLDLPKKFFYLLQWKPFKKFEKCCSSHVQSSLFLKIFTFLSWLFGYVEKRLDKINKANFKIYDVTAWTTNSYKTHIAQAIFLYF